MHSDPYFGDDWHLRLHEPGQTLPSEVPLVHPEVSESMLLLLKWTAWGCAGLALLCCGYLLLVPGDWS